MHIRGATDLCKMYTKKKRKSPIPQPRIKENSARPENAPGAALFVKINIIKGKEDEAAARQALPNTPRPQQTNPQRASLACHRASPAKAARNTRSCD